jgi:hypothetical protein
VCGQECGLSGESFTSEVARVSRLRLPALQRRRISHNPTSSRGHQTLPHASLLSLEWHVCVYCWLVGSYIRYVTMNAARENGKIQAKGWPQQRETHPPNALQTPWKLNMCGGIEPLSFEITLAARWHTLAGTSALITLEIDGDSLGEVVVEVAAYVFLCECLSCDNCLGSVIEGCEDLSRLTYLRMLARH